MSYYSHQGQTYPYSGYHHATTSAYPGHPQTPGAYPATAYQTPYPTTSVQGYGATWPYPYSYYPQATQQQQQQQQAAAVPRPVSTPTAGAPPTAAPTPVPVPQRVQAPPTAYAYVPRESVAAAGTGGATRRQKQATYRGLFTKERTYIP